MNKFRSLFLLEEEGVGYQLPDEPSAMVQHEVLFENETNSIVQRPLFIGTSFSRKRFVLCVSLLVFFCSLLVARSAWMQLFQADQYQSLAERNRLRQTPLWPRRGIIRDRNNTVLAENISQFQITLLPSQLPKNSDDRSIVLGRAARLLGRSVNDFLPFANATGTLRDQTVLLATSVPYPTAMGFAIQLPDLPGFTMEVRSQRRYPFSPDTQSLSHVLGYVGKLSEEEYQERKDSGYRHVDEIGKTGLERSYEDVLRGTVGVRQSEVDARGRVKALVGDTSAIDGQDVVLSLDLPLQQEAERVMRDIMDTAGIARGSLVALDPRNGEVLALVSLPAFDHNLFSGGVSSTVYQALTTNENHPLFPRAWSGVYPSGSTVKIVVSVAALMERVITPQTTIISVGGLHVGPWFFPDWKAGGHGSVNVRSAIAWSVNTFYYMVGGGYESFTGLGVDRLTKWMRIFGLGEKTGIDLPTESSGFVPSKEWKKEKKQERWFVGDTYNLAIGQGDLLVTPLQVAEYTATIANRGFRIQPHVASVAHPTSTDLGIPSEQLNVVRAGMRDNVLYGSGRSLGTLAFPVSGKTGTAQWNSNKKTHAWFTSFAPYESPEIVVTVMLEEGGEGSSVAVPVAKRVLQAWWNMRTKRNGVF